VRNPDVDAIIVATPNHLHRDIVLAAVAAGKHVFVKSRWDFLRVKPSKYIERLRNATSFTRLR
jgi:hypothetical protein